MKKIFFLMSLIVVGVFLSAGVRAVDRVTVCDCTTNFINTEYKTQPEGPSTQTQVSYESKNTFKIDGGPYPKINLGTVNGLNSVALLPDLNPTCESCETEFANSIESEIDKKYSSATVICAKYVCDENSPGSFGNCSKSDKDQIKWDNSYGSESDPYVYEKSSSTKKYDLKVKNNASVNISCENGCDGDFIKIEQKAPKSDNAELTIDLSKTKTFYKVHVVEFKAVSVANIGMCVSADDVVGKFYFRVDINCGKILTGEEVKACEGAPTACENKCKSVSSGHCEFVGNECKKAVTASPTAPTAVSGAMSSDAIKGYYEGYYAPPEGYRASGGALPDCAFSGTCRNVNDLLQLIINFGSGMFAIIGSFAFAFFVYGGFTIVTSFGNAERVKKGRDIMVAAVVGMVISLSAYLLIDFMLDALKVAPEFRGIK